MKWLIVSFILVLMLMGCGDPRTAKQNAQRTLLYELENCEHKFGDNSYDEQLSKNSQYCAQMTALVERKIDEGFFENGNEVRTIIKEKKLPEAEEKEEDTEVEDAVDIMNDIVGTI